MDNPLELTSSPRDALQQLIGAYRFSILIYVAAELRIADGLKEGAKHFEELARVSGAHPDSLYRVLRALASVGIFNQLEGGRFELNASAENLLSDVPGSLHVTASMIELLYSTWGNLLHSVKTGENAFEQMHGMSLWEYCKQNPPVGKAFAGVLSGRLDFIAAAVAEVYDFTRFSRIVDVGGG